MMILDEQDDGHNDVSMNYTMRHIKLLLMVDDGTLTDGIDDGIDGMMD